MSKEFETLADGLVEAGTPDEDLYRHLSEHMDRNGVQFVSFGRYADQPAIVRLFGERGVGFVEGTDLEAKAALAKKIRRSYAPGLTPLPGESIFEKQARRAR